MEVNMIEIKETKITIKDFTYKVKLVNNVHSELKSDIPGSEILGKTDVLEQIIYIRNNMDMKRTLNTIIHEITHAFVDTYGFSNRSFNEEELCTFLEIYSSDIISLSNTVLNNLFNCIK